MTNFIFSAVFAIIVALASVMGSLTPTLSESEGDVFNQEAFCNIEPTLEYQLSEEEQIDLYEQVMDECVVEASPLPSPKEREF